jgi:hypothetical protein
MAIITKEEVLQRIKELRDAVNDIPDPTAVGWDANGVLAALDRAGDIIEFPNRFTE